MNATEYFIEYERQHYGPYDLISMIRKVRNGQVTRETVIICEEIETPTPAGEIPVFSEVFHELEREGNEEMNAPRLHLGFAPLVKSALEVLMTNLSLCVYTGVFLLAVIMVAFALYSISGNGVVTALLGSIAGYFFFALYQMAVLRKTRMQLLTGAFFISMCKRFGLQLLIVSALAGACVFALPILLAQVMGPVMLALILLPGSLLMLALFYAPILVADRGVSAAEAIRGSIGALKSLGSDNFIVIYMLLVMNYIAACLFMIPLLITLPMTVAAFCELYDDHLNQFRVA